MVPVARFVKDVTVADGSAITVGTTFMKTWRFQNNGGVAWPEGTQMVWDGGDLLGFSIKSPVPAAQPGTEIDISVSLSAPTKLGRNVSYWRLADPKDEKFGPRVWVDVLVEAKKEEVKDTAQPAEEPKAEVKTEEATKFAEALKQIEDMGFHNKQLNVELMRKFNGDVIKIVQELLNHDL